MFYQLFGNDDCEVIALSDLVNIKGGKRLPKDFNYSGYKTAYPYIRVEDFENGRPTKLHQIYRANYYKPTKCNEFDC